ncbi:MAG: hypothetical protein KDA75_05955, partial [Planctomycetaceae bacterium]|nr:hypothetical protein [Planctomycetaceae bacterium]
MRIPHRGGGFLPETNGERQEASAGEARGDSRFTVRASAVGKPAFVVTDYSGSLARDHVRM